MELENRNVKYKRKTMELSKHLPYYWQSFVEKEGHDYTNASLYTYTLNINQFFQYLLKNSSEKKDFDTQDIPLSFLEELSATDIEEYIDYLRYNEDNGSVKSNGNATIKNKLEALRTLCNFLHKEGYISHNPMKEIKNPKIEKKEVRVITEKDIEKLLRGIQNDNLFSGNPKQMKIHKSTMYRDIAIILLLYETGIRISELTELKVQDVDLRNHVLYVKGTNGINRRILLSERMVDVLKKYLGEAEVPQKEGIRAIFDQTGEEALFLSRKLKKIAPNSVEFMLRKYTAAIFEEDIQITPAKLRNTCGRELYKKTKDIDFVAKSLGHINKESALHFYK